MNRLLCSASAWCVLLTASARAEKILVPDFGELEIVTNPQDPLLYAHEKQVNRFLGSPGFGLSRELPPAVPGVHGVLASVGAAWDDETWHHAVEQFDLVGLLHEPTPRVYLIDRRLKQDMLTTDDLPPLSGWKTYKERGVPRFEIEQEKAGEQLRYFRRLDVFERIGLEQLARGANLVARTLDHEVRALGAIRAMSSCLDCHTQAKEGDLLGAFTYFVSREKQTTQASAEVSGYRSALRKLVSQNAKPKEYWDLFGEPMPAERKTNRSFWAELGPDALLRSKLASYGIVTQPMIEALYTERKTLTPVTDKVDRIKGRKLTYEGAYPRPSARTQPK